MTVENKDSEGNDIVEDAPKNEDEKKLVEENETLKGNVDNLVEEIKVIRKERAEFKTENERLVKESEKPKEGEDDKKDVKDIIKEVLLERDSSKAVDNKSKAFDGFIALHKEFSKENDPSGLKREALERKFKMFDTSRLTEVDDFIKVIKDSASLLGVKDTDPETHKEDGYNPYSSTPGNSSSPTIIENSNLSDVEKKAIKDNDLTEEKYLKLKEKHPDYLNSLLKL